MSPLQVCALGLALTLILVLTAWGALALTYQAPGNHITRRVIAGLWCLFGLATLIAAARGHLNLASLVFTGAFAILLYWWHSLKPTHNREWADDVARLSTGEVNGQQVTLRDVRNFDWRTRTDYTQRWETRSYDLQRLATLDMILSYWNRRSIAHVLVSFGFDDGQHVVFSVEIRRRKQDNFSELGGFFKQFELAIIAADERDIVRVRTNVRGEDDYLYRIRLPREDMRSLFLAYVAHANDLSRTPLFYNTLRVNCTTLVYHMMKRILGRLPMDYRVVLSGYLPGYVYKIGGLDPRYTLEQLMKMGRITERARLCDRNPSFSADIRRGIPVLSDPPQEQRQWRTQ